MSSGTTTYSPPISDRVNPAGAVESVSEVARIAVVGHPVTKFEILSVVYSVSSGPRSFNVRMNYPVAMVDERWIELSSHTTSS